MSEQDNNRANHSGQNRNHGRHPNNRRPDNGPRRHNGNNNANAPRDNNNRPNGTRTHSVNAQRPQNGTNRSNQANSPSGQNLNPNAKRNNNRRRNNRNKNRNGRNFAPNRQALGPIPQSERRPPYLDRAYEKYQNLLDQHLIARKKYFELFYRADSQQKLKLERNFYQTLFDLRDFEEKATDEIREFLLIKTDGKKRDLIYSENHSLETVGKIEIQDNQIVDPHLLTSQIKADYKTDTEESSGTLEDYNKYKGI